MGRSVKKKFISRKKFIEQKSLILTRKSDPWSLVTNSGTSCILWKFGSITMLPRRNKAVPRLSTTQNFLEWVWNIHFTVNQISIRFSSSHFQWGIKISLSWHELHFSPVRELRRLYFQHSFSSVKSALWGLLQMIKSRGSKRIIDDRRALAISGLERNKWALDCVKTAYFLSMTLWVPGVSWLFAYRVESF